MLMSNASSKFGGIDRSMMPMCYILISMCTLDIVHTAMSRDCMLLRDSSTVYCNVERLT